MTVAITGGTGFVGQAVLEEAARRRLPVRALTRRDQPAQAGVDWVRGDLADHAALADLVRGCAAVVHIAGVVNAPDAAGFYAGNVAGTDAVLTAAEQEGCARFVAVSSLAAREPGLSDYGHSKQQAEERIRASGLGWTIVRPPAIYGPRDTEMFEMFRATQFRIVPLPPEGRTSVIHAADLARLLLDLVPAGEATGAQIYEPDDGRMAGWSYRELARAIGTAMGRRIRPLNLPAGLLLRAARLDERLRGAGAKLITDRARYMAHPDWVCDPARAVPPQLWAAQIDTAEGLAETARWYSAAGWL